MATRAGGEFEVISSSRADQLAQACLGLRGRPVRRVAVVEPDLDPVGDDVRGDPALDPGRAQHLDEGQPADLDLERRHRDHGREPFHGEIDRVDALPGARRVGALAVERQRRVEVPEAARVDRVVGRLEHDDEVGLEHERRLGEDARERALLGWELLPHEEQEREVERRRRAGRPAGQLDHHGDSALHVARAEADHPAVLDPAGDVVLGGHGVEVAGEQDERRVRALRREEERLVRAVDERKRHDAGDVLEEGRLLPARRGDVDQLERAACEIHGPEVSRVDGLCKRSGKHGLNARSRGKDT